MKRRRPSTACELWRVLHCGGIHNTLPIPDCAGERGLQRQSRPALPPRLVDLQAAADRHRGHWCAIPASRRCRPPAARRRRRCRRCCRRLVGLPHTASPPCVLLQAQCLIYKEQMEGAEEGVAALALGSPGSPPAAGSPQAAAPAGLLGEGSGSMPSLAELAAHRTAEVGAGTRARLLFSGLWCLVRPL